MFIVLIWTVIVSGLVNETHVYQKCKSKECVVVVKDVGYSIEVKK